MFARLLLPLLAALLVSSPAVAKPPVWVVKDEDSSIVLFGSIHLLPPGLDWRSEALDAALKEADDLWFELPLDGDSSRETAQLSIERGQLPEGERLSRKLSPEGARRLKQAAKDLHLNMRVIDRMQPWLADLTISIAKVAREGANKSDGVEYSINAAAPATAQRKALENGIDQILFLAEAPEHEQLTALEDMLRDLSAGEADYSGLVAIWMSGDFTPLQKEVLDPMRERTPSLYSRMVTERNARWTEAIIERLAGAGETVVVVGAAHLVGEDGLPAMLRKRGITVEGP